MMGRLWKIVSDGSIMQLRASNQSTSLIEVTL